MAGIKEIRTRIDSVQQTLKITNAMYLISSSKLRRARQQLNSVQPYFMKISSTIADILHHSPEIEHIYFDKRPERKHRRAGYIVITGDKGLAGAYNHNVLRLAEEQLAQEDDPTLFLIGQMGRAYFAERDIRVDGEFMFTVQDPTIARARDIADIFIRLFREDRLDDVYVIYTEMVTPMRLEPRVQKLLRWTSMRSRGSCVRARTAPIIRRCSICPRLTGCSSIWCRATSRASCSARWSSRSAPSRMPA